MTLCTAPHTSPPARLRGRRIGLPACPVCGDVMVAPTAAVHVNEHVVRNHWSCDSCGHEFRKSVSLLKH
jgi:transcription elongation factor Elf1